MPSVLVTYSTVTGTTEKIARAVADGAAAIDDTDVTLKLADEVTPDDLAGSDAIIIGTPVHMGSIEWRTKKMIDESCGAMWIQDGLIGKVGAVFASGSGLGNAGGGAEMAMMAVLANMAELGMIIVPLPKNTPGYHTNGLHWGPTALTGEENGRPVGVPDEQLEVARHHGMNVARVATALAGKMLLNP